MISFIRLWKTRTNYCFHLEYESRDLGSSNNVLLFLLLLFCLFWFCFVLFFVHGFSRTFGNFVKKSENNHMFIMNKYHRHVGKFLHGLNFLNNDPRKYSNGSIFVNYQFLLFKHPKQNFFLLLIFMNKPKKCEKVQFHFR